MQKPAFSRLSLLCGFTAAALLAGGAFSQALAVNKPVPPVHSDPALAAGLVPHKAEYDIRLLSARNGSQIINVSGKMSYSWEATCEGWVTEHSFGLTYEYAENAPLRIDSKFSTLESEDGKTLRFYTVRKSNGEQIESLRGIAKRTPEGGKVTFEEPADLTYDLDPSTLFPMTHTLKLLADAQAGKKFLSLPMFDGSDAEGPIQVSAVVGKPLKYDNGRYKLPEGALKPVKAETELHAWPMQLAFFPLEDKYNVEPDYELKATLLDNGVITDMVIDYGDFRVGQNLKKVELLPVPVCTGKLNDKGGETAKAENPKADPKPSGKKAEPAAPTRNEVR